MAGTVIDPLYWDDSYPIALLLRDMHPTVDPVEIEPDVLYRWVITLRHFADDPAAERGEWLERIQAEWIELI